MKILLFSIIILFSFSCNQNKVVSGIEMDTNQHLNKEEDSKIPHEYKTLYVASYKKDCEGVASQSCYLVKENPEDEWELFYNEIEGFEYSCSPTIGFGGAFHYGVTPKLLIGGELGMQSYKAEVTYEGVSASDSETEMNILFSGLYAMSYVEGEIYQSMDPRLAEAPALLSKISR